MTLIGTNPRFCNFCPKFELLLPMRITNSNTKANPPGISVLNPLFEIFLAKINRHILKGDFEPVWSKTAMTL